MRITKLQLSFSLSDADFLQKALFIILCMTGNVYFPTPIPTLADVQTAADAYAKALKDAASRDMQSVAQKNAAREALRALLAQLGMYVMFVANGDETILTSSGFTLTKFPQPVVLDNPGNVTLTIGANPGELLSQVPKQNATGFIHQITDALPTDATVWVSHNSSKGKFLFQSLTPGKQHWVRVIALGTRGQMQYSTVGTQMSGL